MGILSGLPAFAIQSYFCRNRNITVTFSIVNGFNLDIVLKLLKIVVLEKSGWIILGNYMFYMISLLSAITHITEIGVRFLICRLGSGFLLEQVTFEKAVLPIIIIVNHHYHHNFCVQQC